MCALSLAGYQVSDGPSSALDEIDRKWIAGHFQLMWSGAGPVVLLSRTGLIVAAYQQARWFGAEPEQRDPRPVEAEHQRQAQRTGVEADRLVKITHRKQHVVEDRKSTRLNSSHVKISY